MTKIACLIVRKRFEQLNLKYAKRLKGREGRLVNATHDEINDLIPDIVKLSLKPHKYKRDVYKLSVNPNHNIGLDKVTMADGKALKEGMEDIDFH